MARPAPLAALLLALIGALVCVALWPSSPPERGASDRPASPTTRAVATFVGSEACAPCHGAESSRWQRSQHRLAMLGATPENVKGRFDGARLGRGGTTARFSRKAERFRVRTIGEAGQAVDVAIDSTLGVFPLQQYLVARPGGRLQALPFAWDTRDETAGGQRWLDLYPGATRDAHDPLHWTRPAQNWNHVCADCHVTAFRKRFDAAKDAFDSEWHELGVGCESCHGPGSAHVAWASGERERPGSAETGSGESMGLVVRLDERRNVLWTIDGATGNAVRSIPRTTSRELEVCAPCHARRSSLTESWQAGEPFLDHYRPALLEEGLYFADGQQRDEVYTWGSFLQSRMHAKGVGCSDCHDPHSGTLRAEGSALCTRCHAPTKYAVPGHHRHAEGSAGSGCVACHMPATTYMQVDPRHDHSLRVPRPDQSVALGVPNACNACHVERTAAWADEALRGWLGRPAKGFARHAEAIHAREVDAVDAGAQLRGVAGDLSVPAIIRATALARLDASRSRTSAERLAQAARDPDPLVRLGALEGLASAPDPFRAGVAGELLRDPRRAVRFEAVRVSASAFAALSSADRASFEREALEYVASLRRDADRPEARTQLGVYFAERGDAEGARQELEAAIRIEPAFAAAYVNLADLERATGREDEAMRVLEAGLAAVPESAALHHARGLARVRRGETTKARADLARAVELEPRSARFAYVLAVALHSAGAESEAVALLERTADAHPGDRAVREALASYAEVAGDANAVARHRAALARLAEADP